MAKVESIFGKFKTEEEKNAYIEASFQTIQEQNKKITTLEAKVRQLEGLLTKTAPVIAIPEDKITPSEEQICRDQLKGLNSVSKERELTLEETRKVEIYSKILAALAGQNKQAPNQAEGMDLGQLLELVKE